MVVPSAHTCDLLPRVCNSHWWSWAFLICKSPIKRPWAIAAAHTCQLGWVTAPSVSKRCTVTYSGISLTLLHMVTLFFSHWHAGRCHFHCPGCLHAQKDLNFFLDKKNPPLTPNSHTLWKISSMPSPGGIPAHCLIHLLRKQTNKDVAPHPNIVYNTFNHLNYENCYIRFFFCLLAAFVLMYYLPVTRDYFQLAPEK